MGEFEHTGKTGSSALRTKRLWAVVALGTAALLVAAWATVNDKWLWSGLPDRACWSSIDRSLLTKAAPPGDGSWEVEEMKDEWGDPECTVQRGEWRLKATVMKTPLKAHLWWTLGRISLPHDLPGMIKVNGDRVDGWLRLPQCRKKLVNVNVPGAEADRRAAADLAARTLLAVGNSQIAKCGGKPFPVPRSFDWPALKPVHLPRGESPCGVADAKTVRRWARGEVSQLGALDDVPASRCTALEHGEEEHGLGLFSAVVLRDRATLDAFSPTGIRAEVLVSPGRSLKLTGEDLRFDRDAVTALLCAKGRGSRYVHVFASGTDAQYAAIKRAVLNKVAATMGCR
ncbi:hypothetical protein AB0D04_26770 [Streptomyces sp. NPDC048483]|uniref:hypothetical protein n=1 Tax=Streptomyces sp. NPDC048483 TaxID=3154927 RepID=UPI0034358BE3